MMNDVKKPASHECGQITIIPCSGILEEVFPYFPPPVGGIPNRRFFGRDEICPVTLVHLHLGMFMVNVQVNIPYIEIFFFVWVNDERPKKPSNPKKKQLGPGQYFGPLASVLFAAAPVLQSFARQVMASQPTPALRHKGLIAGQKLRETKWFS